MGEGVAVGMGEGVQNGRVLLQSTERTHEEYFLQNIQNGVQNGRRSVYRMGESFKSTECTEWESPLKVQYAQNGRVLLQKIWVPGTLTMC